MTCVWAAPPTRMSSGLRAHQGVCTHNQGLTCERATWGRVARTPARPPTACAPEWPGPSAGGITPCKGATRRRHAARRLRVVQNPHRPPVWRALEGVAARRAWPRCRGPASVPANDSSTQPRQISHAIPPRHGSMHTQKPQNINDQTSTLEIYSGELHAKLMGERPVGPQAASPRRECPLSGQSAARPCHGLGCSPGAPRRPSRTRRGWTRGRSTGRRAPWPRSCRAP